jgi:hypothetical protein
MIFYGWRKREGSGGWSTISRAFVMPKPQYIDISKFPGLYPISNCLSNPIYPTYWAYFVQILIYYFAQKCGKIITFRNKISRKCGKIFKNV